MTQAVALAQQASTGVSQGFKNRIINGAMVIDQRNAGASVTTSTNYVYPVDRFRVGYGSGGAITTQQSTTVPASGGFANSLYCTPSTTDNLADANDFYAIVQTIEGYNVADLGWGSASAKTVCISFWVRSSITGTYSVTITNNAGDRCYPATYTISSANTWQQVSVTIAGDTSGTWLTTNGTGMFVSWNLGGGSTYASGTANAWNAAGYKMTSSQTPWISTNGATFYITGVQLEVGSTATSFDYRPYGTELQLCQRYYETNFNYGTAPAAGVSFANSSGHVFSAYTTGAARSEGILFAVPKRGTPNITFYRTSLTGSNNNSWDAYISGSWTNTSTATGQSTGANFTSFQADATFSGMSTGSSYIGAGNWTASAEL